MTERGWRFMKQVGPDHWVIQCRACGKRRSKKVFDRALDCHEYWRDHIKTQEHIRNVDPNYFSEHDAEAARSRELLDAVFGKPASPGLARPGNWLSDAGEGGDSLSSRDAVELCHHLTMADLPWLLPARDPEI